MRTSLFSLSLPGLLAAALIACEEAPSAPVLTAAPSPEAAVPALASDLVQALRTGRFDDARSLFLDTQDWPILAQRMHEEVPPNEVFERRIAECQARFEAVSAVLSSADSVEITAVEHRTPPPQAPWFVDEATVRLRVDGEERTLELHQICEANGHWRLLQGPTWAE